MPMYGMPTRVRNLYLGPLRQPGDQPGWTWDTLDRDIELAIHEFAPGATLVRDKRRHLCVGFTSPLPDIYRIPKNYEIKPHDSEAFSDTFYMAECNYCGAWRVMTQATQAATCQACGHEISMHAIRNAALPAHSAPIFSRIPWMKMNDYLVDIVLSPLKVARSCSAIR